MVDPVTWTAPGLTPMEGPVPAKTRFPWTVERVSAGERCPSRRSKVPSAVDRESFRAVGTKSG